MLPAVTQPYAWRVSVGTCLHMCAPVYRTCVHMYRVYVARTGRDQRILVALPFPPSLSGPLPFHVLFLETKVERKSNRLSPTRLLLTARGSRVGESAFVCVVRGCVRDRERE